MTAVATMLAAILAQGARVQPAAGQGTDDRLSIFGQEISAAVDRAADLSVYASLCGVGSDAHAVNLRNAAARKIAECFKEDPKATAWSADVAKQFDGKRALLLDVAQKRGKDAVCRRLYESDGKSLSALGKDVATGAAPPIAARPCP
jgi:hypothetical protein